MIANHQYRANVGCQLLFIPRSVIFLLCLAGFNAVSCSVTFANTYAPKPLTVYVFLNTECPISQQYARRLSVLSRQYASSVRFVALFPSKTDTPRLIQAFGKDYGLTFPGRSDVGGKLARQLRARVTPEVVVLDTTGRIRYRGAIDDWYVALGKHRSDVTEPYLLNALNALMAGNEVTVRETEAVGCLIE